MENEKGGMGYHDARWFCARPFATLVLRLSAAIALTATTVIDVECYAPYLALPCLAFHQG